LMGEAVVELYGHRIRCVRCAYPVYRQDAAAATATVHDPDHDQNQRKTNGPHDPRLHPLPSPRLRLHPKRSSAFINTLSPIQRFQCR
jgi:hypothetical protein